MTPPLTSGLVAIVSIIARELEAYFRDEGCQSGEGVLWREPLRSGGVQVRILRRARIVGDHAGITVVMEAVERKGNVNQIRCETFRGGAVVWRYAILFVGRKTGMVKAVEDIDGCLDDSAGGQHVFDQMMAEQEHELLRVERLVNGCRFIG